MRAVSSLQPSALSAFAPPALTRGEMATVAASSSRRAAPSGAAMAPAPAERRRRAPGAGSWIAIGLAAWAILIGGRAQIVRLAPATAPLYASVGLGVNLRQMDIGHVTSRLADEDGRQILIVEGEIHNLAEAPRAAPRMRLSVLDSQGQEIYFWTAAPPKARLAAGEKAEFRARLAAPPKEGRDVRVRFAAESDRSGRDR